MDTRACCLALMLIALLNGVGCREHAEVVPPHEVKESTVDLGDGVLLQLVWCPPGDFLMGSPQKELGRSENERQHRVTLTKGFWIGRYEVTQAQWVKVMGRSAS